MEYTRGSGITTFGEYVLYVPDNIDENTSVLVFNMVMVGEFRKQ